MEEWNGRATVLLVQCSNVPRQMVNHHHFHNNYTITCHIYRITTPVQVINMTLLPCLLLISWVCGLLDISGYDTFNIDYDITFAVFNSLHVSF